MLQLDCVCKCCLCFQCACLGMLRSILVEVSERCSIQHQHRSRCPDREDNYERMLITSRRPTQQRMRYNWEIGHCGPLNGMLMLIGTVHDYGCHIAHTVCKFIHVSAFRDISKPGNIPGPSPDRAPDFKRAFCPRFSSKKETSFGRAGFRG